ncbi:hypothetical protein E2C01_033100 [Portunus trituberculatus]|uniref:Uncharacterized protein n=1 Tax=Portunus trituberculatus TaxID=210409 RepID=A0A5B7EWY4_PORTR|nr:hypothetical protein [Portunus trituberculatus]
MAVTKEQPTVKAQVFFPSPDRNEGGRTGGHKAKRIYEYEVREALREGGGQAGVAERRLRTAGHTQEHHWATSTTQQECSPLTGHQVLLYETQYYRHFTRVQHLVWHGSMLHYEGIYGYTALHIHSYFCANTVATQCLLKRFHTLASFDGLRFVLESILSFL